MKIIIVGAGEVGYHIASRLALENKDVVVIDQKPEAVRRIAEHVDAQVIQGSGSSPVVLERAGLKDADILLAVTNSDEINLIACLVANMISPATKKLARIRHADFDNYHALFKENAPYIDTVINPEIEVIKTIETLMCAPGAVDVGEFADGRVNFVGVRLSENSRLSGIRLMDLRSEVEDAPLIAAVVRKDELIIPRGNDRLHAGDLVYFISERDRLEQTLQLFGKQSHPVRRAIIVGGGQIGTRLARKLVKKGVQTKVVEKDVARCDALAEQLNKAIIIHGDASDQTILSEENIRDTDMVVTLTDDEETNILVSLLAKRMGARAAITKISKFSYLPLMPAIGIDQVVSPRLSAIDSILRHIRKGRILSALSVNGEQAEVMEAVAMETSDIVGKPLKKIQFPKGALLIGVVRDDAIIIPSGATQVEPGDRVIIFARRPAVPKIEKILTVKLEFF